MGAHYSRPERRVSWPLRLLRFCWRGLKTALVLLLCAAVAAVALPVELNITGRSQYPSLPNGCEAVAASVSLSALGAPITAESFASQYLPQAAIGSGVSPAEAYIGDPFGNGYYCYPEALTTGINAFLATQDTSLRAQTHRFVPFTEIAMRLHLGKPVIVWMTIDDRLVERSDTVIWQVHGRSYRPYDNLHVVVIDGLRGGRVHLVDSVNGDRWLSLAKFLPSYYSMGLRAVTFTD